MISTTTGADLRDQILSPVYVSDNVRVEIENDAAGQWRADYSYEVRRLHTDSGDSTVASANVKTVIHIEVLIGSQKYADALAALGTFNPDNAVEQNYKDVLTILANVNYPTMREATNEEIESLSLIAEQHARTAGAAVTLARLYLAAKYNSYFQS